MQMAKTVLSMVALIAFSFGAVRIGRRFTASAVRLRYRRDAIDLVGAIVLVGSLAVLVHARWWWDDATGWARHLVVVLYVSWLTFAVVAGYNAIVRLGAMLCRSRWPENRRMKAERNVGTAVLTALVVGSLAIAGQYSPRPPLPPRPTQGDVFAVTSQVVAYDRMAELRQAIHDIGADPEAQRVADLTIPTPEVEREFRRLFERWNLADDPLHRQMQFPVSPAQGVRGLPLGAAVGTLLTALESFVHPLGSWPDGMSRSISDLAYMVSIDNAKAWSDVLHHADELCLAADDVPCDYSDDLTRTQWSFDRAEEEGG